MTYQFKIQIKGITKPPVWRRILVPDSITFQQLHFVIQEAFGWENAHLYSFSDKAYGGSFYISEPDEMDAFSFVPRKDASKLKLRTFGEKTPRKVWFIGTTSGMTGYIRLNWRLYPMRLSCMLVVWQVRELVLRKIVAVCPAMNI